MGVLDYKIGNKCFYIPVDYGTVSAYCGKGFFIVHGEDGVNCALMVFKLNNLVVLERRLLRQCKLKKITCFCEFLLRF